MFHSTRLQTPTSSTNYPTGDVASQSRRLSRAHNPATPHWIWQSVISKVSP